MRARQESQYSGAVVREAIQDSAFRDMGPAELAKYRENLATATKIRPANKSEVEDWLDLDAHKGDVGHTAYMKGQAMRIVKTRKNGFRCEPIPEE